MELLHLSLKTLHKVLVFLQLIVMLKGREGGQGMRSVRVRREGGGKCEGEEGGGEGEGGGGARG